LEATRRSFNKDFLLALAADFKKHGAAAIEKVRKTQPAVYMKICALLVPREMKVEHAGGVKAMSDEEIEQAIELIQTMLAARAGEAAKVIEGTAEPAALPAPNGQSSEAALEPAPLPKSKHKPNRLMLEADNAVGPRERTRKSPPGG
jgi:2-oxoglutarate dehydrogenase complex dehydrogenase (E1) component-like enzyme